MIKKVLLSIATLLLIWQSYKALLMIDQLDIKSPGLIILIAWILNMLITGIFAFSGFAFSTQKLLPLSYYKISNPSRLKKIYKNLKVNLFRTMLLATLWKSKQQREKYFNGRKNGINNLITQSKKSEFGHLIPLIILSMISMYFAITGKLLLCIAILCFNILGNLYPIILQRHHRMRIQILQERQRRNHMQAVG